jgi:flavin-dependent dehydrogenase
MKGMEPANSTADVAIVGGGPAGLAAAIALRLQGADCLVIEGLGPGIDKGCGEGLMPNALEALQALGVEITERDGHLFRGIRFRNSRSCADALFPGSGGIGVRRTHLHRRLIARAEEVGVRIAWNARARLLDHASMLVDGKLLKFRWLVGADGQSSSVRRWAGLEAAHRDGARFGFRTHYRMAPWSEYVEVHWAAGGQAYITPVAADCVCVAWVTRAAQLDRENYLAAYPELQARLKDAPVASKMRGAVSATRKLRCVARNNVALVGDASGSVDAVTGEGLAISFRQAMALAEAIAAGDLAGYRKAHRSLGRVPHAVAQLLLSMDRWPAVQRRGLRTLEQAPELFHELLAVQVGSASLRRFALAHGPRMAWSLLQSPGY